MACPDRSFSKIAKPVSRKYTKVKLVLSKGRGALERGAVDVTEIGKKIRSISLPPHQLRELGLREGWQKNVSEEYIDKVVKTAERYKDDLRELSKR